MNLVVQRFKKGHPLYTEQTITNTDPNKGVVGTFKSVFGQWVNAETGAFICYNLERFDTLIEEGTYKYTHYFSPANKCDVLLLHDVPHKEYVEVHIANWAYQLKACSAPCTAINLAVTGGISSGNAFKKIMTLVGSSIGTIKFETSN